MLALGLLASPASAFDNGSGSPFAGAATLSPDVLATERARGVPKVEFGDVTIENNTLLGGGIGSNSISASSFSNANGFFTVMQNTGNGAVLQHATVVQLGTVPAPGN